MTPPFKSVKIEMFQTRIKRNHKGNICIMGGGRPGVPRGARRCPGGAQGGPGGASGCPGAQGELGVPGRAGGSQSQVVVFFI